MDPVSAGVYLQLDSTGNLSMTFTIELVSLWIKGPDFCIPMSVSHCVLSLDNGKTCQANRFHLAGGNSEKKGGSYELLQQPRDELTSPIAKFRTATDSTTYPFFFFFFLPSVRLSYVTTCSLWNAHISNLSISAAIFRNVQVTGLSMRWWNLHHPRSLSDYMELRSIEIPDEYET